MIGLCWLAAGIGLLLAPGRMPGIVAGLETSPAMVWLAGLAAFALGVAILIPHHMLTDPLSIVATLIAGIVAIVAGAILFLAGFTGRADALP